MTVNARPSVGAPVIAEPAWRAWIPVFVAIAVTCAVFALAFRHEIAWAVKVWNGSTAYNHCYLVLPLVAMLLWQRRNAVAAMRPSPSPWALALVPALSVAWLGAALLDIIEAEQLIVMAMLEVLLVALLGWRVYRALLAPLLLLFFLVPFGAFLVPSLQRFTAGFAAAGLELLGIPVFADRLIIQIPAGAFEVAEACAGLRFLIASIVFGCFFAMIVYRSPVRRVIFIALSILFPVVANGLRALGLILFAHFAGSGAAIEADHILYGWIFFSLVTLVLIAVGMTFAEARNLRVAPEPAVSGTASRSLIGATMAAGLVLALVGPAYLLTVERAAAAALVPVSLGPAADSGWVRDPVAASDWWPEAQGADQTAIATYLRDDLVVTEFVALYRLPARGNLLTRTAASVVEPKEWRLIETRRTTIAVNGATLSVNTAKIARQGRQQLVWWLYAVDGQATPNALEARLLQARAALRGGGHLGALIAVSTGADGATSAESILGGFLKSLQLLPGKGLPIR